MALEFSNTNQSAQDGFNIMTYGGPGSGKTRFIATMPRPIVISAERGNLTLRQFNIPVIYVKTGIDLRDAYNWCLQNQQYYDSIALDSTTDIAQSMLTVAKGANNDGRKAYGDVADLMMSHLKNFRNIPGKHKYFIAQLGMMKDEGTGQMRGGPEFPGNNLTKNVPYLFDFLFRAGVQVDNEGKKHFYLQTGADQSYDAKDRLGVLPQFIAPDFQLLMHYAQQGIQQ